MRDFTTRWVFPALLTVICTLVGGWLTVAAFDRVVDLRQLERVPEAKAGATLPGEVVVNATAMEHEGTVLSTHTRTPSLYYRYTHERQTTDSDGNTSWETIDTRVDKIDFLLEDETGRVLVKVDSGLADWSVKRSVEIVNGVDRYREYRIEPGQRLFVFAIGREVHGEQVLRFEAADTYTPIVSNYSRSEEQASFGAGAVFRLWGGLTMLAMAVLGGTLLLGVHRVIAYLSMLTVVLVGVLVQLSVAMMKSDLSNGLNRYQTQVTLVDEQALRTLAEAGYTTADWSSGADFFDPRFSNLQRGDALRLRETRIFLQLAHTRLRQQMQAFPERWLRPLWDIQLPQPPVAVPEVDQPEVQSRIRAIEPTRLLGEWTWILVVAGFVLALLGSWFGCRQVRHKRLIENLPTQPTAGVSCGLAETTGTVVLPEGEEPLSAPLTGSACTWFHYLVEEKRRSGKKTRWVTIEQVTRGRRFECEDAEGRLAIDPADAEVVTRHRAHRRRGKQRFTETTLRIDDALFAIGCAEIDKNQPDRLVLGRGDESSEPFILSNRSEVSVMLVKARRGMLLLNVAFSTLLLAALVALGMAGGFAPTDFLLAALLAPVYLVAVMLFMHYNDLVYLRGRAARNWANIEVSLRKRRNVVTGLEKVIKAYLQHERDLQQSLARVRSSLASATDSGASLASYLEQEHTLSRRLVVAIEAHPDLKSDELTARFMTILTALETEIALLRKGYNDAVELFNSRIASIPDVVFARWFGFLQMDYAR